MIRSLELKQTWMSRLTDINHKAYGALRDQSGGFSVLGVLCAIFIDWTNMAHWESAIFVIDDQFYIEDLPPVVQQWAGLTDEEVQGLWTANNMYVGFDLALRTLDRIPINPNLPSYNRA